MCTTSTLGEISRQHDEKLHISLVNRFLSVTELLTRYHDFYANAEPLISSSDPTTKKFFQQREAEFRNALQKQNTSFSYDTESNILHIRLGDKKYKQSVDHGSYLTEIGEDGSVIGIEIFNVNYPTLKL